MHFVGSVNFSIHKLTTLVVMKITNQTILKNLKKTPIIRFKIRKFNVLITKIKLNKYKYNKQTKNNCIKFYDKSCNYKFYFILSKQFKNWWCIFLLETRQSTSKHMAPETPVPLAVYNITDQGTTSKSRLSKF